MLYSHQVQTVNNVEKRQTDWPTDKQTNVAAQNATSIFDGDVVKIFRWLVTIDSDCRQGQRTFAKMSSCRVWPNVSIRLSGSSWSTWTVFRWTKKLDSHYSYCWLCDRRQLIEISPGGDRSRVESAPMLVWYGVPTIECCEISSRLQLGTILLLINFKYIFKCDRMSGLVVFFLFLMFLVKSRVVVSYLQWLLVEVVTGWLAAWKIYWKTLSVIQSPIKIEAQQSL